MFTLRRPFQNNESAGWIIDHSLPYGIGVLANSGLLGHSADLHSNNLMIKNIAMNDSRNGSEYQCVIFKTGDFNNKVVESGNVTILHVAGEYQYGVMYM